MSEVCKQDTDRVLLVEGDNDCHVVMALCAAHSVPETFGIYQCGSDKGVLKRLNALIVRPNPPQVIGVMLDADSPSLVGRWDSIKGKLRHYSYPLGKAITRQALRPHTEVAVRFTAWLTHLFT